MGDDPPSRLNNTQLGHSVRRHMLVVDNMVGVSRFSFGVTIGLIGFSLLFFSMFVDGGFGVISGANDNKPQIAEGKQLMRK